MRCWICPRPVTRADAPKRVEWRQSGDGLVMFGQDQPPLEQATGKLVKVAHGKCYHAWRKTLPNAGP